MYIFFWFFKQLYYILKRFTKHKFLLLLVFFVIAIILFLKPSFAYTFDSNVDNNSYTVPNLDTLPGQYYEKLSNGYIIQKYTYMSNTNYRLIILNSTSAFFWHSSSDARNKIYCNGENYTFVVPITATSWGSSPTTTGSSASRIAYTGVIYYGSNIYANENKSSLYYTYIPPVTDPFIVNTSNIPTWDFTRLLINMGDLTLELPEGLLGDYTYYLNYNYNEQDVFTIPINEYYVADNTTLPQTRYFSVPNNIITNNIVIRPGYTIWFSLTRYDRSNNSSYYDLGSYTLTVTQEQADIINQNNQQQQLSDINTEQQKTTNAINDLNNTITDSNVEDSSIYLPTDNTNDITQEGLNGIFTSIYNAFCIGEAQDIIFPIPFTNKNIILQPNYISQMLQNSGASWVIYIIQAFWWYLISVFIVKDITNKITKIKSGNIEDIENSNIKGDML